MFLTGWSFAGPEPANNPYPLSVYLHDNVSPSAMLSRVRVCRLSHKGNPDPSQMLRDAEPAIARGDWIQYANERNHPIEGFTQSPAVHLAQQRDFKRQLGNRATVVSMPPSPDSPNPLAWFPAPGEVDIVGVHCYGGYENMIRHLNQAKQATPGARYLITELNFGWGNSVHLDSWANNDMARFAEYCLHDPTVIGLAYFAPVWSTPDTPGTTPVNGSGTAVEAVLRRFADHARENAPVPPQTPPAPPERPTMNPVYETHLSKHYQSRQGRTEEYCVIHTSEGNGTWKQALDYLISNDRDVSAHLLVGPNKVAVLVPDHLAANHAGYETVKLPNGARGNEGNLQTFGIEMLNKAGQKPDDATITNGIMAAARWCRRTGKPSSRVISHQEIDGTRRSDPTGVKIAWFRGEVEKILTSGTRLSDWSGTAFMLEKTAREARAAGEPLIHDTIVQHVLPLVYMYRDK